MFTTKNNMQYSNSTKLLTYMCTCAQHFTEIGQHLAMLWQKCNQALFF